MMKKLKDLTLEEILFICDNTEFGDCYCGGCRLGRLCAALHIDLFDATAKIKEIYESEVETGL